MGPLSLIAGSPLLSPSPCSGISRLEFSFAASIEGELRARLGRAASAGLGLSVSVDGMNEMLDSWEREKSRDFGDSHSKPSSVPTSPVTLGQLLNLSEPQQWEFRETREKAGRLQTDRKQLEGPLPWWEPGGCHPLWVFSNTLQGPRSFT